MNYCVDCRYGKMTYAIDFCRSPKLGRSLVTGEIIPTFAIAARASQCKGDWFEPKPQEIKKKWWQFK